MDEDNPRIFLKVVLVACVFIAVGLYFSAPYFNSSQVFEANKIKTMASAKTIWDTWVGSELRYAKDDVANDIHNVAGELAQLAKMKSMPMEVSDWILPFDKVAIEAFSGAENLPKLILRKMNSLNRTVYLQSDFKRAPISWSFAVKIPADAPKSTPVMWTRGLKPDGTWDLQLSPFEEEGGYVLYVDGRVRWFDNLNSEEGGKLYKYGTRERTNNIEEAVFGGGSNILSSKVALDID